MTVDEFYNQEMNEKVAVESCFANTIGITYCSGEIEQEQIHAVDEMKAFAEAYHQTQLKLLGLHNVSQRSELLFCDFCKEGNPHREHEHKKMKECEGCGLITKL